MILLCPSDLHTDYMFFFSSKFFILHFRLSFHFILKFQSEKVGFLNFYAPNPSRDRLKMWIELDRSLLVVDHWCVGSEDRSGEGGVTMHGLEL